MLAGRLNASSIPVTMALKSPTVCSRFITRRHTNSDSTQEAIATANVIAAQYPKNTMDAIAAGIIAMITSNIIFCVEVFRLK